ncbi:MAG: high frequency lysogenization protein HflD [Pseudomonadota bacterium]
MNTGIRNRTIALAGLYQCVDLVTNIAWNGQMDTPPFKTCIYSLFSENPETYEAVYGGLNKILLGLEILNSTLDRRVDSRSIARTQCSVMLIFLEKRLRKTPPETARVRNGIQSALQQLEHFDMTHVNVISNLADIYRQSISPLGPKIIIKGEQSYLSNPDNASRIRALLLAGIRAVLLWRQAGGNRWRLLSERKAMLKEIKTLMSQAGSRGL